MLLNISSIRINGSKYMKFTKILRMRVIVLGFGLPGDLRCKYIYSSGAGEARRKKKRVRQ